MTETPASLWPGRALSYPSGGWGVRVSPEARDAILNETAAKHGLAPDRVMSKSRSPNVAQARQEVMWRLRALTAADGRPKHSYPAIGRALGGLDHTTVLHGVRAHAARLAGE